MHLSPTPGSRRCIAVLAVLVGITSIQPSMATVIDVNSYRFDPLVSEPTLPRALQCVQTAGPALYLVQFSGPVEESWKAGLMSLGARFYGYIPDYTFIVRMDRAASETARALPHVQWVGPYHVAYRISPEIGHMTFRDPLRVQDPDRTLTVLVADNLFSTVDATRSLGTVLETIDDPSQPGFVVRVDPSRIPNLARLPEVLWVEEKPETFILNNTTRWVVQSNQTNVLPIWNHGIFGEGQIVCEMDTGLDYNSCWFRETDYAPPGPTHRKVIDYKEWGGVAYDGCAIGHGTHVAGTVVGDQSYINNGIIDYNGMAYKAKIMIQDVGQDDPASCSSGGLNVPSNLVPTFTDAYSLGARVHTNSWGSSSHAYNSMCANVDNFMWSHPDFLICFANGNDGPSGSTVGSPATAKDCVSVGADEQAPTQDIVASYSSRGPAVDGRFKPTVMAPGGPTYIVSANNHNGNPPAPTCATQGYPFTGTSMATPAVAGCALLIRDYFAKGFYPIGVAGGNPVSPSAALVKAMLVNSARDMGTGDQPNNNEGWGRLLMDDALYFQGDTRELHAEDNAIGIATGEAVIYNYRVDSSAEPLEVTLVWTDFPASPSANPSIVNNLNLVVTSPSAARYLGNVYSGGESTTGGTADNLNVEECVRLTSPEVGMWTITVQAANVPQGGQQPYALVTTGSFGNWPGTTAVDQGAPSAGIQLDPARPNPTSGSTTLAFRLPSAGTARLTIFDASGRHVATLAEGMFAAGDHRYEWSGRSDAGAAAANGVYFYRLETDATVITRKLTLVR
jgi:hypothetical protein